MRTDRWLAAAALMCGIAAWAVYFQRDLVLSHYDAKAHLVVARRVIDSLTPGWQQFGAVWLPLPHLLQVFPTQIDLLYRTGAFGSALSIVSFAVCAGAATRLVLAATGSPLGAVTAGLLLMLNPNVLYLQATPMTEPLLLAATFVVVLWMYEWLSGTGATGPAPRRLGWAMAAALWTRYEAWLIVAATLVAAVFVLWRRTESTRGDAETQGALAGTVSRVSPALRLATWPAAAVLLFVVNSRITVGAWFVTGGFYEPDPFYQDQAWRSLVAVWWGTHQMSGYAMTGAALAVLAGVLARSLRRRTAAAMLVPAALFAAAALPLYAFYQGHPFRIRYMVPTVAACALFAGLGVGFIRRPLAARAAAALLVAVTLLESPPLSETAPMVQEAQWDVPRSRERRIVSACLAREYGGERVLASMGSLAHYMQELSHEGFAIADFIHEGNGVIWELAMETGPAPHAGWMLVEEQAEGGDVIAQRLRSDPAFANGMERLCEGGGVALYRRE